MKKIALMVFVVLFLATGCLSNVQTQSIDETSELPVLFEGSNFTLYKISPDIIVNPTLDIVGLPTSEKEIFDYADLIVKCRLIHEPEHVSFVFDNTKGIYNTTLFTVEILKVFYTEQDIKEGDIVKYFDKTFIDACINDTQVFESNGDIIPQKDQEFYALLSDLNKRVLSMESDIGNAELEVTQFDICNGESFPIKITFTGTDMDKDLDNSITELTKKYKG